MSTFRADMHICILTPRVLGSGLKPEILRNYAYQKQPKTARSHATLLKANI